MIHRQIEKLQNMVNGLLGLCAASRNEPAVPDDDFPPQDSRYNRLGVMILKLQDGVLEERYLRRMEKWLACDQEATHYFVEFQMMTALLRIHYNPERLDCQQILAAQ